MKLEVHPGTLIRVTKLLGLGIDWSMMLFDEMDRGSIPSRVYIMRKDFENRDHKI